MYKKSIRYYRSLFPFYELMMFWVLPTHTYTLFCALRKNLKRTRTQAAR